IFVPAGLASPLWNELLQKGEKYAAAPVGLGARDTLRVEMKYPLYGNDIDDERDPFSAGLGWVVKIADKDCLGKASMEKAKADGVREKWVGFRMLEKAIPRAGYRAFSFDNEEI